MAIIRRPSRQSELDALVASQVADMAGSPFRISHNDRPGRPMRVDSTFDQVNVLEESHKASAWFDTAFGDMVDNSAFA